MPRKVFVAGEILTAADVNTNLMDQAVMSFAGTAARGSAIPSPVEGMAAYLEDQNILSLYDGSAWKNSLSVTGGIVAVKSVIKTDSQTGSVLSGAALSASGLTISHACSSPSNKLILIAQLSGTTGSPEFVVTGALTAGGSRIAVGDAAGSRPRVGAQNNNRGTASENYVQSVTLVAEYSPASTSSVTYGVDLINPDANTRTLYINRSATDTDTVFFVRAASSLILMEVAG
jgi:hypothetical protein